MHLTYSEIKDQGNALAKTLNYVDDRMGGLRAFMDRAQPRSLAFLGCGSSHSIAESLALAAQIYLKLPAVAIPAGDYMLHPEPYAGFLDGTLAVVLSRSGSTSEALKAVELLKAAVPAHALGICCAEETKLARLCDEMLEMPWGFDRSVCQTRSVSCLYTAGMYLIALLSGNTELADGLRRAVAETSAFMKSYEDDFKFLASKRWTNAVVLSDAELNGIGAEAALAFQEICRIPGAHHHVLDVRHGPMVLIGRSTLVVAAVSGNSQYERALLEDVAKKGAELLVVSDTPLDGLPDRALNVRFGGSLPHAARGLPLIQAVQHIAYWRAVTDGVDPDRPEGLDPWIKL